MASVNEINATCQFQVPPADMSLLSFEEEMVIDGVKYCTHVEKRGPDAWRVILGSSHVDAEVRSEPGTVCGTMFRMWY
jgi:hypothetical protein